MLKDAVVKPYSTPSQEIGNKPSKPKVSDQYSKRVSTARNMFVWKKHVDTSVGIA